MTVLADNPALADRGDARVDRDEEFCAFYAEQFPHLAGYCLALTSDAGRADELAQDALTEVYVK